MKHKRVWTEEQKLAARDRMAHARSARGSRVATLESVENPVEKVRDPEVQAVIDTMTPERKAKLAAIQSRQWQRDAVDDKATREALERHEAAKNGHPLEMAKAIDGPLTSSAEMNAQFIPELPKLPVVSEVPFKTPFRLTGSQSGMMISELSPCLCGEQRLKWHPVCLKVKVNG
jgi:hypothetical protein